MRRIMLLLMGLMLGLSGTTAAAQTAQPLPELEVITPENIDRLELLAQYGEGTLTGTPVWSPDGETIAVPGSRGVWFYDADDLTAPPRLLSLDVRVEDVAFSPDGRMIAFTIGSIDEKTVHVWDTEIESEVTQFSGDAPISFNPDGIFLAAQLPEASGVTLWRTDNWLQEATLDIPDSAVEDIVFSPDGTLLITISRLTQVGFDGPFPGIANIWQMNDLEAGSQQLNEFFDAVELNATLTESVAFSRDGTRLAIHGAICGLCIIQTQTNEVITFEARESDLLPHQFGSPVFSPDSKMLYAIASDQIDDVPSYFVRRWDTETGELLGTFSNPRFSFGRPVLSLKPTGSQIMIDRQIWDMMTGEHLTSIDMDEYSTLIRDRETILRYAANDTLRLIHALTGEERIELAVQAEEVAAIVSMPANALIMTIQKSGNLRRFWDARTGDEFVIPLSGDDQLIEPYLTESNDIIILRWPGGENRLQLEFLNPRTNSTRVLLVPESVRNVYSLEFTSNPERMILIGQDTIEDFRCSFCETELMLWDLPTNTIVSKFIVTDEYDVSENGTLLARSTLYHERIDEWRIELWNMETQTILFNVPLDIPRQGTDQFGPIIGLGFKENDTQLIIDYYYYDGDEEMGEIQLWEIATQSQLPMQFSISEPRFGPRQNFELIHGDDWVIALHDAEMGEELYRFPTDHRFVSFNDNQNFLIANTFDSIVYVYGIPAA